ncbi:LptF/LptG family permease [Flavisericum labens]|uniref:LptF/LptG family permease n=1 Tax=Flavisericum labens TaxID=3377112 RepID=UPI00387B2139
MFIILMLIFVLQTIWLYIKELAGKDLDLIIIFKFLAYFLPKLIPLVLPLTILLSSIMVFGSFAENYEFAAMKSTGISLQRAMSGLSVFIVILGITTFFFSNNVIPWAELNSYNLRRNIAKLKPAMVIAEGQFNSIDNTDYNIKVEKKSGDRGQFLEDVTIHVKDVNGRKNTTVIIAKTGELTSPEGSNVLKLILNNGHVYKDNPGGSNKLKVRNRQTFAKSAFEKKIINIDLSDMNNVDFDEQSQTDKYNMLDVMDLDTTIDSLIKKSETDHETFSKNLHVRSGMPQIQKNIPVKQIEKTEYTGDILDIFDTKKKIELVESSLRTVGSSNQLISSKKTIIKTSKSWLNKHIISFHEKFALAFACIILFFVGAPLGALIRKGGMGLPMVIAILLFLTYHFIGIFATNSAKNGGFNPILASWFSTLLMLPLGIFLTKRATADKSLFDFDSITEPLKRIFKIKEKDSVDYKFLSNLNNNELIELISDYESLGHEEPVRFEAIKLLNARGLETPQLEEIGVFLDKAFLKSEQIVKNYSNHVKFAKALYFIGVALLVLFFVFKNNKLPSLAQPAIQLSVVSLVLFVIYYLKSIKNVYQFYGHINKNRKRPKIYLLMIGLPLYIIVHLFLNQKIKEDLKQNCLESLK